MNTDIRLLVSFRGHRKRRRLEMMLGKAATGNLIDLWLAAAEDRPDGMLEGWDETDIALAANWEGDAGEFVGALFDCRWIEKTDSGTYFLHDWEEHQGWASSAKARSESAKKAAKARWDRKNGTGAESPKCEGNAPAMRPHQIRNAPSPSPSPSPSQKDEQPSNDGCLSPKLGDGIPNCPQQVIIAKHNEICVPAGLPKIVEWDEAAQKNMRARWREKKERQDIAWWVKLFEYIAMSDYLTGKITRWRADLRWIVRPSNMAKIINGNFDNRGPVDQRRQRELKALQEFLGE